MWIDLKGSECQVEECGVQKIPPLMDIGEGGSIDIERDGWGRGTQEWIDG